MGIRVALAGLAVCGPTGVADSSVAADGLALEAPDEVGQLAGITAYRDAAVLDYGDARRVIASVLEPL